MCARFSQIAPPNQLELLLSLPVPEAAGPRYNIAPTQLALAVVAAQDGWEARMLRWGLIPSWAKDASIGQKLLNARAETVDEKPSFRNALRKRRCLILATSFFEWQHRRDSDPVLPPIQQPSLLDDEPAPMASARKGPGPATKHPFVFRMRSHEPFALAGLWESWLSPEGALHETFTILTTQPNELVARWHDRMPCILEPADFSTWLDPLANADPARLRPLMAPLAADKMECYPVGPAVGNPRFEDSSVLSPIGPNVT